MRNPSPSSISSRSLGRRLCLTHLQHMSSPEGGKAERCDCQSCYSHMFKWGEALLSLDADFTAHFYLFIFAYICIKYHF